MVSFRIKENILVSAETILAIVMIIVIVFAGFYLLSLYLCIHSQECVSTPSTPDSIAIFVALFALGVSIILFIITHKLNFYWNRIIFKPRKDQLKNHLKSLRKDYLQIICLENEFISTILNQKNVRIGMIEHIINSSIHQFSEIELELLLTLTEFGLRFPMSLNKKDDLDKECNMMISYIDQTIDALNKKKWKIK